MRKMLIFALSMLIILLNVSFNSPTYGEVEGHDEVALVSPEVVDFFTRFEVDYFVPIVDNVTCDEAASKYENLQGPYEMAWIDTPSEYPIGYDHTFLFQDMFWGVWDDTSGKYVLMIACGEDIYVVEGNSYESEAPFELA